MLRYAIAHPDGRLFSNWRYSPTGGRLGIIWTDDPSPMQTSWYRRRTAGESLLEQVQAFEPEARLVEQETEDL